MLNAVSGIDVFVGSQISMLVGLLSKSITRNSLLSLLQSHTWHWLRGRDRNGKNKQVLAGSQRR